MHFLKKFQGNTLKYDFINVFNFKSSLNLPKLKAIILNLKLKTCNIQKLSLSLLAFELMTQQQAQLIGAWKSKIVLKVRDGNAVGCKLTIKKSNLFNFFNNKSVLNVISKLNAKEIKSYNMFQFTIENVFDIYELKNHYNFFYSLRSLNIVVLMSCNDKKSIFFFKSLT